MRVERHGKPSKQFTSRLRAPTSDDFERMVSAVVEAIVGGSTDVLVLFPYTMKFPEDFPKGILMEKRDDGANIHRIKAKKLLVWLKNNGHTDITMEQIRGEIIASGLALKRLEDLCCLNETGEEEKDGKDYRSDWLAG